jgi:hypothetical protein
MLSDMLFAYEEHRTKDSYANKPEESEQMKSKSSGFDNPKKISSLSHNLPWQKLPTKYRALKREKDPCLSIDNQFLSDKFRESNDGFGT